MSDMDRKEELLRATLALLENIEDSCHADALSITAVWDEVDCDGYCLMDDINSELAESESSTTVK